MFTVSSGFLTALRAPSMTSVTTITTSTGATLFAQGGSVEMDSRRGIGRTCNLELGPTDVLDLDAVYALITSPSVEVTIARGLMVNGVAELVPLGVFSVDTIKRNRRTIQMQGSDRSKKISRARFTDAYTITAGTTLADAGTALLQSRWSQMPCDFGNVTDTVQVGLTFDGGANSDPWAQARNLFADHGYELVVNGSGIAKAVTVPDPAKVAASFDFGIGETNLVTDPQASTSFEQTYNGVIVTGEGSGVTTPVRGEAWDTDPTSPTYYQSGFGLVPRFYSSPLLTTSDMCVKAAQTMLAKSKGRVQQFEATAVVNPALEPLDVVAAAMVGVSSRYVVDKLTMPLRAAEPMKFLARETSTV